LNLESRETFILVLQQPDWASSQELPQW